MVAGRINPANVKDPAMLEEFEAEKEAGGVEGAWNRATGEHAAGRCWAASGPPPVPVPLASASPTSAARHLAGAATCQAACSVGPSLGGCPSLPAAQSATVASFPTTLAFHCLFAVRRARKALAARQAGDYIDYDDTSDEEEGEEEEVGRGCTGALLSFSRRVGFNDRPAHTACCAALMPCCSWALSQRSERLALPPLSPQTSQAERAGKRFPADFTTNGAHVLATIPAAGGALRAVPCHRDKHVAPNADRGAPGRLHHGHGM